MDLGTFIGSKVATAINVNGLYVDANSLTERLQYFTEPALFHTDGLSKYSLSKSGSLTKVEVGGRYFVVLSAHQVFANENPYEHDQLSMHNSDTGKLLTSHRAVFPTSENDHDYDAVLYEFTEAVQNNKLPEKNWFKLDKTLILRDTPSADHVIAIGYPGYRNTIDYDAGNYRVSPNAVHGREVAPAMKNRLSFRPNPPIDYKPSGMSGGPVFGLRIENYEPILFLAGVVVNASAQVFNFMALPQIAHLFKRVFESSDNNW